MASRGARNLLVCRDAQGRRMVLQIEEGMIRSVLVMAAFGLIRS
jgi:hypothetical protein